MKTRSKDIFDNFLSEFAEVDSKEAKLELLLDMGRELELSSQNMFESTDKVKGCSSLTMIKVAKNSAGGLELMSYSDSLFARGYIYIFVEAFHGYILEEFIKSSREEVDYFISELDGMMNLVPSRMNTFYKIFQHIYSKAVQLQAQPQQ